MKSFPPAKIRNVALVGHGGSGKTTLAESLLFCSGTIPRQGRVEDGTATTDFDPEEVKRHISLSTAMAPFEHDGHKINLLDTPGYADFSHDAIAALRVADLAVFVVSAVDGVEVQTEVLWRGGGGRGLAPGGVVFKHAPGRGAVDRAPLPLPCTSGRRRAPPALPV